jgi:hypothetical protein
VRGEGGEGRGRKGKQGPGSNARHYLQELWDRTYTSLHQQINCQSLRNPGRKAAQSIRRRLFQSLSTARVSRVQKSESRVVINGSANGSTLLRNPIPLCCAPIPNGDLRLRSTLKGIARRFKPNVAQRYHSPQDLRALTDDGVNTRIGYSGRDRWRYLDQSPKQ